MTLALFLVLELVGFMSLRLGQEKEGEVVCFPGFSHGGLIECWMLWTSLLEMMANLEYSKFEKLGGFFLLAL